MRYRSVFYRDLQIFGGCLSVDRAGDAVGDPVVSGGISIHISGQMDIPAQHGSVAVAHSLDVGVKIKFVSHMKGDMVVSEFENRTVGRPLIVVILILLIFSIRG